MDTKDKRVKREIANSNERRRMQSINAGFQKLKRLLPVNDGEKLSKASILQSASDYIQQIEQDRRKLYEENLRLRGMQHHSSNPSDPTSTTTATIINNNNNLSLETSTTTTLSTKRDIIAPTSTTTNNSINAPLAAPVTDTTTATAPPSTATSKNSKVNSEANDAPSTTIKTSKRSNGRRNANNNNNNNNSTISTRQAKNQRHASQESLTNQSMNSVTDVILENGSASQSVIAKAAIALPLDVPYTSETAIRVGHPNHDTPDGIQPAGRKLVRIDPTTTTAAAATYDSQNPSPKGQTLGTLCKAIREIEGDCVFKDENMKQETTR